MSSRRRDDVESEVSNYRSDSETTGSSRTSLCHGVNWQCVQCPLMFEKAITPSASTSSVTSPDVKAVLSFALTFKKISKHNNNFTNEHNII